MGHGRQWQDVQGQGPLSGHRGGGLAGDRAGAAKTQRTQLLSEVVLVLAP